MNLDLANRVVLVTGGAGRLGRAICAAFAREGACIGVADLAAEAASATGQLLAADGARTCAVGVDVAEPDQVARMLEDVTRQLGPVDVLVNAHGVYPNVPLLEMDVPAWDAVYAINARGTMLTCQAVARQLVERGAPGAIVNLSSAAAASPRAGGAAYSGSKAAVNLLTLTLAIELGPHDIRVNAVEPGMVLDQVYRPGEPHEFAYVVQQVEGTPMRRSGAPEDIAEAVVFLCGFNNPWLTGAILPVTGGSHAGRTHVPPSPGLR